MRQREKPFYSKFWGKLSLVTTFSAIATTCFFAQMKNEWDFYIPILLSLALIFIYNLLYVFVSKVTDVKLLLWWVLGGIVVAVFTSQLHGYKLYIPTFVSYLFILIPVLLELRFKRKANSFS